MRITSHSSILPVACIVLVLGASPACGGDESPEPKHRGERQQKLLLQFDSDRDGKLDDTERATARAARAASMREKHPELFARIDTDNDGVLSREELQAGRAELRAFRVEKKRSPTAASARVKERHPELFKRLDTDHDGQLDPEELQAGREQLRELRGKPGEQPGIKPGSGRQPGSRRD